MGVVASQRAVHRRRGEEDHVRTAVVLTCAAGRTARLRAWDAVLESYSVACELQKQKSSAVFGGFVDEAVAHFVRYLCSIA